MNYTLHMTNGDDLFHKEFSADEFCKFVRASVY